MATYREILKKQRAYQRGYRERQRDAKRPTARDVANAIARSVSISAHEAGALNVGGSVGISSITSTAFKILKSRGFPIEASRPEMKRFFVVNRRLSIEVDLTSAVVEN